MSDIKAKKFTDIMVRVWEDGDISIHNPQEFQFCTMYGVEGLQCNFEEGSNDYECLRIRLENIARGFLDVQALINEKQDIVG